MLRERKAMDGPHPGSGPIDPLTEEDLGRIESMDLGDFNVLNALARLCGIRLETVNPDRTRWYATPRNGPTLMGTYTEVRSFVKGYALGYHWGRCQASRIRDVLLSALNEFQELFSLTL